MSKYTALVIMLLLVLVSSVSYAADQNPPVSCEDAVKYLNVSPSVKDRLLAGCNAPDAATIQNAVDATNQLTGQVEMISRSIVQTASGLGTTANEFIQTDAGKFTAVMIAWRVMGTELLQTTSAVTSTIIGIMVVMFIWWLVFHITRKYLYTYTETTELDPTSGKVIRKNKVYGNFLENYLKYKVPASSTEREHEAVTPNAVFLWLVVIASFTSLMFTIFVIF